MSDNIQTKNWVGTDADDHFIIDNINYDDISNSYHDIRGGLGNDIYEVNLDTGNLNYYRGGEGNDTYILYRGGGIYVDEINADGDGDDTVYIKGTFVKIGNIELGEGNDTLYLEAGDGAKTGINLGNGNNLAFISGGSNFNISSYANRSKLGKSTFNVSAGTNHGLIVGGGDTVNISGGNTIGIKTSYYYLDDVDALDANIINITGGKSHNIKGKLMNVTIGTKGAAVQPTDVSVELENNSRDVVTVNGGTGHRILNTKSVTVNGGEVITISSAKTVTVNSGNRITVEKVPNVLVKSGNNVIINSEYESVAKDDIITIEGGSGNKAYGGKGVNVLTISGGNNNYVKSSTEGINDRGEEGFDTVNITGGSNNTAEKGYGNVNYYLENGKSNKILADTEYYGYENRIRVNGGTGHSITGGNSVDTLTIYKDNKANNAPTNITANLGDNDDVANIKIGDSNTVSGEKGNDTITLTNGKSNKFYGGEGNDKITISSGTRNTAYGGNDGDMLIISGGTNNTIFSGAGDNRPTWSSEPRLYDKLYIKGGTQNYAKTTDSTADYANEIYVSGGSKHVITGGKGADNLVISGTATNISANLGTFDKFGAYSENRKDVITLNTTRKTTLTVTGGTQTVVNAGKSAYSNTITVKGGSKISVTGGKKVDTLIISGGKYIIANGGNGNDKLTISGGKVQTLKGGKGSDIYTISLGYKALKNKKLKFTIDQSGDTTKASKDKLVLSGLKSSQVSSKLTNNKKDLSLYIGSGSNASVITIKNWKTNNLSAITFKKDKKTLGSSSFKKAMKASLATFPFSNTPSISSTEISTSLDLNNDKSNQIIVSSNV